MMCAELGCPHRVMLTPMGWAHVDTHGADPGHMAWPAMSEADQAAYWRELRGEWADPESTDSTNGANRG